MRHLTAGQHALLEAALQQRQQWLQGRLAEHHGGLSRAEHARELLEQDGHDAPRREAERELDMAQSDRDTLELAPCAQRPGSGWPKAATACAPTAAKTSPSTA
jgi:hypothetical protein